jgi:hypothetical protein
MKDGGFSISEATEKTNQSPRRSSTLYDGANLLSNKTIGRDRMETLFSPRFQIGWQYH